MLDSKWGINQGFDTYFDNFDLSKYKAISLGAIQRPGNEVVDHGLQWLDESPASRFFCWLHLYDPHAPYEPPEPYRSIYRGRPYLGEIAFVDAQVGRVIAYLEAHQLLDRTIVVVMGDHGESLGDHGEATHGFFVYESVAHVPLIIRAPFSATLGGRRVADVVRSVDVMPTVLEMLGIAQPKDIEGTSVASLMTGAARELNLDTYTEAMYPLHHFGWSDLRAMRAGRYKLIAAPRPELYDLQDDPGESHDLFARREALGNRMLAQLHDRERRFVKRDEPEKQTIEVDPDARARLAGARLRRHVRRVRRARRGAHGPGGSQGQDRSLQQDHRGARHLERRCGVPGSRGHVEGRRAAGSQGHRRLVHARQHVRQGGAPARGDRRLQADAGAEARR